MCLTESPTLLVEHAAMRTDTLMVQRVATVATEIPAVDVTEIPAEGKEDVDGQKGVAYII